MAASSIFVIAEAGVNHNGDMRTAEHLILAAKRAEANAVKFQLFDAERLKRPGLKPLELSAAQIMELKLYAERQGIEFMCTPFDPDAVHALAAMGVNRLKIGSGCITDKAILEAAKATRLPIILSTGMSTLKAISWALVQLGHEWPDVDDSRPVTLLHCTSAYPCPIYDVNLRAMMDSLHWHYGDRCEVGYSDHTQGITVAIAAAAMGARVIEKHLTLDRTMSGPDHSSSIEPGEFKVMVSAIRTVEEALGDGIKKPRPSEHHTMEIWGRA